MEFWLRSFIGICVGHFFVRSFIFAPFWVLNDVVFNLLFIFLSILWLIFAYVCDIKFVVLAGVLGICAVILGVLL